MSISYTNDTGQLGLVNRPSEGGSFTNDSVGAYATAASLSTDTKVSALAAEAAQAAAEISAAAALVSEGLADADATATAADLVATNQDSIDTAADAVSTAQDVTATAADAVSTAADVVSTTQDSIDTALDAVATAADVVSTSQDATATAADLVLTNADAVSTNADRVAIENLYDTFDDRYLGTYAADPALDNDGDALLVGAMYFNSTVDNTKFYNGVSWEDPEATATQAALTATTKASEAAASASAALVSEGLADSDAIATAADAAQTALDRIATAADVAATADKIPITEIGVSVQAYDAATSKTDEVQTYTASQIGEITALTDAASVATDLALSNNYSLTLAGNRTLANPTNIVAGQSGSLFITQDGTGSRTSAFGSYWKFVGGTAPVLSTAAASVDRLDYVVKSATEIHAVVSLDVK
jgi:hypothetical protein